MKELWKAESPSAVLYDDADVSSTEGYFTFTVSHLQVAFVCLVLGFGLSFVLLLMEILYHRKFRG